MTVIDINRILGPLPYDEVASRDPVGLVRELDRLRIDAACVVHTHALYGDPSDGNESLTQTEGSRSRLRPVPVLIPGPLGTPEWLGGARLVRLCPVEHGWSLTGEHALILTSRLARSRTAVLLGFESVTAEDVHALAGARPELRIVLTGTGYRRMRELAELMERHERLSVDTSTLAGHLQVEWLARRYGAHRVLFGTGAPVTDDAGPRYQLDTLDLPESGRSLIAGGNALRLLGESP
ncbi:amidohydrolase family protein [Streptomyces sp. NPDC052236]|uniref:amidohydrolase family protein n=1 Tax=Streptomyces sp. NPDC052236 TaxID=3365686 RepID=UPI0037D92C68